MSKAFQEAQEKWCEGLLSQEALCDAVAILGAEHHRKPFIRALLANLSEPMRCALYGEFKEGITQEVRLEQVSVDAFDVMLRSSCGLDPKLNPKRALEALQVAKMYLIEQLEAYCLHYLRSLQDCNQILETMTLAAKGSYLLPEDFQLRYWATILYKCREGAAVVDSVGFQHAHGSIIAVLVKLNELQVDEEQLWTSLLSWSANAVKDPELLGPFAAVPVPSSKRIKVEDGTAELGVNEALQRQAILSRLAKDVRFATMRKEFFADHVRAHLPLEELEPATLFFLANRVAPGLVTLKRSLPEDSLHPIDLVIESIDAGNMSSVQNLAATPWTPSNQRYLRVSLKDCIGPAKVKLRFSDVQPGFPSVLTWSFVLTSHQGTGTISSTHTTQGNLIVELPIGSTHFLISPCYEKLTDAQHRPFEPYRILNQVKNIQVLTALGPAKRAMKIQRSLASSQSADEA